MWTKEPENNDEAADMTSVNSSSEAIDEDGALDAEDHSPLVNSLSVKTQHVPGAEKATTLIIAMVHAPTGFSSKRMAVPGELTANKLAELIRGVATW